MKIILSLTSALATSALAASVLAFSSFAFAGDNGGGRIDCQSGSGRTTISGLAGVDFNGSGPAEITYTIDNKSLDIDNNEIDSKYMTSDAAVFSLENGIYTLRFSKVNKVEGSNFAIFTLYSVPKTFKKNGDIFKFTGVIKEYSIDPRGSSFESGNPTFFDKPIQVSCTLDLSI